jgi:hypothetical protein
MSQLRKSSKTVSHFLSQLTPLSGVGRREAAWIPGIVIEKHSDSNDENGGRSDNERVAQSP